MRESKGVEVGHVFKLGTRYSEKLGATFLDADNKEKPVLMGCYGIGIGRIVLSAVEVGHDDRGILWPTAIAPYQVVITPIKYDGEMREAADKLYDELSAQGVDVLLDDRDDRPGSKFADADLIGIPVRITVGDRGLKTGEIELKERSAAEPRNVKLDRRRRGGRPRAGRTGRVSAFVAVGGGSSAGVFSYIPARRRRRWHAAYSKRGISKDCAPPCTPNLTRPAIPSPTHSPPRMRWRTPGR